MTANLVHTDWEVLDPTPDVNSMFRRFDDRFFSRKLRCVGLEWSKKMYSCAGICYMRKNRLGQSITIRLSEPLLKLRPRKDLVQTLLHEMIHAFAFSKGVREGNGGHGPFFHKMMNEINKVGVPFPSFPPFLQPSINLSLSGGRDQHQRLPHLPRRGERLQEARVALQRHLQGAQAVLWLRPASLQSSAGPQRRLVEPAPADVRWILPEVQRTGEGEANQENCRGDQENSGASEASSGQEPT